MNLPVNGKLGLGHTSDNNKCACPTNGILIGNDNIGHQFTLGKEREMLTLIRFNILCFKLMFWLHRAHYIIINFMSYSKIIQSKFYMLTKHYPANLQTPNTIGADQLSAFIYRLFVINCNHHRANCSPQCDFPFCATVFIKLHAEALITAT